MKLTINQYELKKALQVVTRFTKYKNSTTPILEYVNVVNEDGQIYFYASNAYRGVKYHISKCEFNNLTSFKLDPQVILNLLSIYTQHEYVNVTFHTEIAENVYFIDIGDNKNIPLPAVIDKDFPRMDHLYKFETEKEDLALCLEVEELFNLLLGFRAANCTKVKFIRTNDNKNVMILGNNNFNIETILVPTKF